MHLLTAPAAVVLVALLVASPVAAKAPIGLNLPANRYFTQEVFFADVFKHFSALTPQKEGEKWGVYDDGAVTFDNQGYPSSIADGHVAQAIWDIPQGYPTTQHTLTWEGEGEVSLMHVGGSNILVDEPGLIVFTPPAGRIGVKVESTPATNIRLYGDAPPGATFRQPFLDRWAGFAGFRYHNWAGIKNATAVDWSDRTLPTDQDQTSPDGLALEYIIEHANTTQTNPWLNVPHEATDDYIREMALYVRDHLDPGLKAHIEYSNEVWNGIFTQAAWARAQAPTIGEPEDFTGQMRFYSKRSVDMFQIYEEVFTHDGAQPAGMDRLVRVMATQAGNSWTASEALSYQGAYLHTDALAIAPYFGDYPETPEEAGEWKEATHAERIDMARAELHKAFGWMDDNKRLLLDDYPEVSLIAYEGGQHFLSHPALHGDKQLEQVWFDLNRSPEMRDLYREYLSYWELIGGEEFFLFAGLAEWTKWGSWGVMEYEGQPIEQTPKLQGAYDFMTLSGDRDALITLGLGVSLGDANLDGVVDAADLSIVAANFGKAGVWSDGDFNGDGVVDAVDFSMLSALTAEGLPQPAAATATPELDTGKLVLVAIGLLGLGLLYRVMARRPASRAGQR